MLLPVCNGFPLKNSLTCLFTTQVFLKCFYSAADGRSGPISNYKLKATHDVMPHNYGYIWTALDLQKPPVWEFCLRHAKIVGWKWRNGWYFNKNAYGIWKYISHRCNIQVLLENGSPDLCLMIENGRENVPEGD